MENKVGRRRGRHLPPRRLPRVLETQIRVDDQDPRAPDAAGASRARAKAGERAGPRKLPSKRALMLILGAGKNEEENANPIDEGL